MKSMQIKMMIATVMLGFVMTACSSKPTENVEEKNTIVESTESTVESTQASEISEVTDVLEDGTYEVAFTTDSTMFHVNEACNGISTLTVEGGKMTVHVSLPSKNIVNLFVGSAENAKLEGAEVLEPTVDTVTYSDGMSEEVNGFDIPVESLDKPFSLALLGTKGKWYDHEVSVSLLSK